MHTQSRKGYRYLVMFTDDAARYTSIYFLRHKPEVVSCFQDYKAAVEKIHNLPILRLQLDTCVLLIALREVFSCESMMLAKSFDRRSRPRYIS
jgi:hypothetical protein